MSQALKTRWMEVLGYAGLTPFVALAVLTALNRGTDLTAMFGLWNLLYGACIVSFLGAVHWGILLGQGAASVPSYLAGRSEAKHEALCLVWGVVPALIAWFVVAFSPADLSLWLMGASLIVIWWVDRQLLSPLKAFDDYLKLRNHLTLGASVSLFVTAAFASMV